MSVSFEKIDQVLKQLEAATQNAKPNDLERDGTIQRFEYTIELLWKVAKKVLHENGIKALTTKEVIRELANVGWIDNPEKFLNYLKMRNESSHTYKEDVANAVYAASLDFVHSADELIKILKTKSL